MMKLGLAASQLAQPRPFAARGIVRGISRSDGTG